MKRLLNLLSLALCLLFVSGCVVRLRDEPQPEPEPELELPVVDPGTPVPAE